MVCILRQVAKRFTVVLMFLGILVSMSEGGVASVVKNGMGNVIKLIGCRICKSVQKIKVDVKKYFFLF